MRGVKRPDTGYYLLRVDLVVLESRDFSIFLGVTLDLPLSLLLRLEDFTPVEVDCRDDLFVTTLGLDGGFETDLFVTVGVERRVVPLSTDCLSEIDRVSDLLTLLFPEDLFLVLLF